MTNAQVAEIIAGAAQRGIEITTYDASIFLGAQEILEREPHNKHAAEVVENFTVWMQTGTQPVSFAEFELPEDCMYTVEEKAEQARRRDECLKATGGVK